MLPRTPCCRGRLPAARAGRGLALALPPNESARWDGEMFNCVCVSVVLEKTVSKITACTLGT